MLLVHQSGSVKVGEIIRYTLTYTPSADRILPSPSHLYVRIKNTSAIPLRAAYLHGPYTIHVSAYSTTFNPYQKVQNPRREGVPQFEPNLKAGGNWHARLTIPEEIRESGREPQHNADTKLGSVTWVIEISSQILFSNTAAVHYEVLVGRDERSLELGFAAIASKGHGEPGKVQDYEQAQLAGRPVQPKGVYSRAVELNVEGIMALWNKPPLPTWNDDRQQSFAPNARRARHPEMQLPPQDGEKRDKKTQKPKKIHLVILTHGLHSNLSADMLFMKESIDAASAKAREDARRRKAEAKGTSKTEDSDTNNKDSYDPVSDGQEKLPEDSEAEDVDDDDEQVIVRGFPGNVVRTERGIQYLGKRLAKYILTLTYPDQPFLPPSKSMTRTMSMSFPGSKNKQQTHFGGDSYVQGKADADLPYTFTKISFIGHSLGGLTQTYAIAYIQKHSPEFFKQIIPTNFICMATPLLGLSNENPLYVKFALDFGLVGRTGQDLGLTWRAPTVVRNGWGGMLSAFSGGGNSEEQNKHEDPRAKPLLRILPTGPAHHVLKMFRNRTVYANVVNDGIVPLRTSSLMFLDWRGLEKVEGTRRDNGLLGTMAQFGWNELTGQNAVSHKPLSRTSTHYSSSEESLDDKSKSRHNSTKSQQVSDTASATSRNMSTQSDGSMSQQRESTEKATKSKDVIKAPSGQKDDKDSAPASPFSDFFNFFRTQTSKEHTSKPHKLSRRATKPYTRSQIVSHDSDNQDGDPNISTNATSDPKRPGATRGDSALGNGQAPPPKTSIFEAAGDIVNPPIPTERWLTDPSSRQRTIFHDRVYHPEDIPSPAPKRPRLGSSFSSDSIKSRSSSIKRNDSIKRSDSVPSPDEGSMKVEERIARAYHRDLSWRKVLVRLEPDAHNNMIVRRMFANAYGWEVVKHLCDTHFSDSYAANTADENENNEERAKTNDAPVGDTGEEVDGQTDGKMRRAQRTTSELREADDEVGDLSTVSGSVRKKSHDDQRRVQRQDSIEWDDAVFEGSGDDENESGDEASGPLEVWNRFWSPGGEATKKRRQSPKVQTDLDAGKQGEAQIAAALTQSPQAVEPWDDERLKRELAVAAAQSTHDTDTIEPLQDEAASPSNINDAEDETKRASALSDVGLQKPVDQQEGMQAKEEEGISEHVARLSTSK